MEQGYNFRRAGQRPPWLEGELSVGAKVGFTVLWIFAVILGIVGLVIVIGMTVSVTSGRQDWSAGPLAAGVALLAVGGAGVWFSMPKINAPSRFKTSYQPIPPHVPGQIFDARFRRPGIKATFMGKGGIQFHPYHLVAQGTLMPTVLLQIGIIVLVTVLPLILFSVGVGLLPAAIIASIVGRKKATVAIPYASVRELRVTGSHIRFECPDQKPQVVDVYVSSVDGERLYRELGARFPAALPPWQG
ncbi:MAG TPA: hypothetical protein VGE07_24575 [Herpetosiphonaceae bacterium]